MEVLKLENMLMSIVNHLNTCILEVLTYAIPCLHISFILMSQSETYSDTMRNNLSH